MAGSARVGVWVAVAVLAVGACAVPFLYHRHGVARDSRPASVHAQAAPPPCQLQLNYVHYGGPKPDTLGWALRSGSSQPDFVSYASLADPGLRERVGRLPRGSRIEYHSTGMPLQRRIRVEIGGQLRAFADYCLGSGVDFRDNELTV